MFKLIAGILVSLTLNTTVYAAELQKETPMNTSPYTLWQLIEKLGTYPSLAPEKIKQLLPTDFLGRLRTDYFSYYDGGPLRLADHITIETIDLRVRLTSEAQGLLRLNIAGACITLEQVEGHYPDLVLTDIPRGRSLEEAASWSTDQPWGNLSFGFKERNPECLADVAIGRDPPSASS